MTPADRPLVAALAALALCAGASAVRAAETDAFQAGRKVEFLIGAAAGGGYGLYANVLAHHIGKHIPGAPLIVPRLLDGAGSLTAPCAWNADFTWTVSDASGAQVRSAQTVIARACPASRR